MKKPPEWVTIQVPVEARDALLKLRNEMMNMGISKLPKIVQPRVRDGAFSQGTVLAAAIAIARAEIAKRK